MKRNPRAVALMSLVVAAGLLASGVSLASNPYLDVPSVDEMLASPAYRYANASDDEVRSWIVERQLPFVEVAGLVPGVRLPGRLTGPLQGISIHGTDNRSRADSPYEILDGRLALALDDFCRLLSAHGVVELVHMTMYRPNPRATQALTRHPGALAIDLGALRLADGTWLRVKRDIAPAIGARTCGAGALPEQTASGRQLYSMLCEAREQGIFHYALTPHFDAAHADHFHLEIKPSVKWFLYN